MAMARIVMANRDGPIALAQARGVVTELSSEWPDVNIVQRTIRDPARAGAYSEELLKALQTGKVNIALQALDTVPPTLPEGLELVAVTKRLEPRCALVAKGPKSLDELADGAVVGVLTVRDQAFLKVVRPGLEVVTVSGQIDGDLGQLASGDLDALILPGAALIILDRRHRIDSFLAPETLAPAAGQGSLGLMVRVDDDLANELAYTLQHRPSFDRVTAERSFAAAVKGLYAIGALASVTSEGEMTLFGAVADAASGTILQATVTGEATEAAELGLELATDVMEQLAALQR